MKHNQKKINNIFFAIFALFLILGAAVPAAAETSIAWSQEIGSVTAADMSEDGQTIYAAVGSQVYIYDAAGVEQNVFTVGGTVVKLVCTADGSKATLYTDGNSIYYIDSGALTWSEAFTDITDIDISNVGNVLIVESEMYHKILRDGTHEYDSTSGTYNLGVIDPNDKFAILQNSDTGLQKYILSTTNDYWGKLNNQTFNTVYQDYQNVLLLYVNDTTAIILNKNNLGESVWDDLVENGGEYAISNQSLTQIASNLYNIGVDGTSWTQTTSSAPWGIRTGAATWSYNNKLWIAGGVLNGTYMRDVWSSSDGATWTQETASAAWSARSTAATWVYNNKMWIGFGRSSTLANHDVWSSSDGVTWSQVTASALSDVSPYETYTWVYNNKLWVAISVLSASSTSNSVWSSSDGVTWSQATSSPAWRARSGAVTWTFNNRMWIAGGAVGTPSNNAIKNDIWYSTNGATWTQLSTNTIWDPRRLATAWTFNNRMWIAGGYAAGSNGYYNDIWSSSDGATWTQETASAAWVPRYSGYSWTVKDLMWIGGGNGLNDVWHTDISSITIQPNIQSPTYLFYNYTGSSPQHTQTTYDNAVLFNGTYELQTKPTLSIYALQTTKSFTGNIAAISLSDRGDWLGTLTASNIYHDQITNDGFGTRYSDILGSTGTAYDIATANSAAMSIVGQSQYTDIYSMTTARVGTYTAGGAVEYVDIAAKNALWATSGGADGKVYIFSKDESSNWYLEYSSDSEDPITALKMSSRGEFVLAGRTSSLTLYQTNTPEQADTNFWFTLYIYKDSDSYRQAAVNVSVYNINNQWQSFAEGLTDSSGKYVLQLTAGNTYKFDVANGQKVLVYQAAPSVPSQVISIHSSPVSAALTYEAEWDPEIGGVTFDYRDSTGQTQTVIVKIIRTDTWETVYEQIYTSQQSIEQSVPIVDDTVGYKVELSASRSSGITRNTWFVSSSRDIVPIPLDTNVKNILFSCFLIFLAGLFSYLSAFRGAIVVCLSAIFFTYMGWLTIPWHWLVVAVVLAFVAGFTQRRA